MIVPNEQVSWYRGTNDLLVNSWRITCPDCGNKAKLYLDKSEKRRDEESLGLWNSFEGGSCAPSDIYVIRCYHCSYKLGGEWSRKDGLLVFSPLILFILFLRFGILISIMENNLYIELGMIVLLFIIWYRIPLKYYLLNKIKNDLSQLHRNK